MLIQFINDILTNLGSISGKVSQFLVAYKMPQVVLSIHQIYIESALFILYSFTEELVENHKEICVILGL
jgi:hypothetical protein